MIVKRKNKYVLLSKNGLKVLGEHKTRKEAEAQERAINISKHKKKK